jgi:hypothetical protein
MSKRDRVALEHFKRFAVKPQDRLERDCFQRALRGSVAFQLVLESNRITFNEKR